MRVRESGISDSGSENRWCNRDSHCSHPTPILTLNSHSQLPFFMQQAPGHLTIATEAPVMKVIAMIEVYVRDRGSYDVGDSRSTCLNN